MKLVIDIPDYVYNNIMNMYGNSGSLLEEAVKRGTPLPKGHGRLIDADDVTDFEGHYITTDAPTIIEADRKEQ